MTVEKRACGGALELLERQVRLEGLREVLYALSTDAVVPETASDGEIRVSAAADSRNWACGGVLERRESLVCLEALCDVLCALRTQLVVIEAANRGKLGVLAAADSRIQACSGVLEVLEGRVRLEALG